MKRIDLPAIPELRAIVEQMHRANMDAAAARGDARIFDLKRGQAMYRYVGRIARTRFCYTPHADTNGDYWAFNEVRRTENKKAKPGEVVATWERTKWVKCAKRGTAIRRAQRRFNAASAAACRRKGAPRA